MKKSIYVHPETHFEPVVAKNLMIAVSGGGTKPDDPIVNPTPNDDPDDDGNHTRQRDKSVWGDAWEVNTLW